jgi:hypothetical protein
MAPRKTVSSYKVEEWKIEKVIEAIADYNPRVIDERTLNSLAGNVEEFGMLLPCVINQRTNRMVGGHQRLKVARINGLETVPVHLVDLDEASEKALNLALNKIEGRWDYGLLEQALADVSEGDILSLSGFTESDLVEIMSGQEEEFTETFEQFTQRFSGRKTSNFVLFRSAKVAFTCSKADYEALVQRLYSKVGVDDAAAAIAFFTMIGLEA